MHTANRVVFTARLIVWVIALGIVWGCFPMSVRGDDILDENFESYSNQSDLLSTWHDAGGSIFTLDSNFGNESGHSLELVDPKGGTGAGGNLYLDLSTPHTATNADPLVLSADFYLPSTGAASDWQGAWQLVSAEGFTGGARGFGSLTGIVGVGLAGSPAGSTDPYNPGYFQGRILSDPNTISQGINPYWSLDQQSTAVPRSSGWHTLSAVIRPSSTTFLVDGQLAEVANAGIATPITTITLGTQLNNHGNNFWIDNVKIAQVATPEQIPPGIPNPDPTNPIRVAPPRPNPVQPPPQTLVHYDYVAGIEGNLSLQPLTLGYDATFAIPGFQPLEINKSLNIPAQPYQFDGKIEHGFNINEIGNSFAKWGLSTIAPLKLDLLQANAAGGIEGGLGFTASFDLLDDSSTADVDLDAEAGINLFAKVKIDSPLLDPLPVLGKLTSAGWSGEYPLLGLPKTDLTLKQFALPSTFHMDAFRNELAALLHISAESLPDEVKVPGTGVTFDFSGDGKGVHVTTGAEVNASAQATADGTVDAYLLENVDEYQSAANSKFRMMSQAADSNNVPHEPLADLFDNQLTIQQPVSNTSTTGKVQFTADGGVTLSADASDPTMWINTLVPLTGPSDSLIFDAEFVDSGGKGLLSVYFDDQLLGLIDERLVGQDIESYLMALPETYQEGLYTLSFRLDPYDDVDSSVAISSLATGLMAVPEPSSLCLAAAAVVGLLCRRRTK